MVLGACGSSESNDSAAPRTKNAALSNEFGARWAGQSFPASAFTVAGLPTCVGVGAPNKAGMVASPGQALLGWDATTAGSPTAETADMIVLESRPPTRPEGPWTVVGYLRKSGSSIVPDKVGKGSFLRVAFYRSTSTPCIGPRSNEVRWIPNVTTN